MYFLPPIPELLLDGVLDRNIANRERIVLRPIAEIALAKYCLLVAVPGADGGFWPLPDHFLWLGDVSVRPPAIINIYTGPGQFRMTPSLMATRYDLYWGKPKTVFTSPALTPILARLDGFSPPIASTSIPLQPVFPGNVQRTGP
jgi:hypothetical protein